MQEATLRVRIPGCWVSRLADDGRTVRIVDRKVVNGREMESLFEVTRPRDGPPWDKLMREARDRPTVSRVRAVTSDDERLLGIVRCGTCRSCRVLASSDCFVTSIRARDGTIEWTVRFDDKRKLSRLLSELRRTKVLAELRRVVPVRGGSLLTRRQAEVLRLALEAGYFEFPKGAGVEYLANRLRVAKSTVSETLHRAEQKILRAYVDAHG